MVFFGAKPICLRHGLCSWLICRNQISLGTPVLTTRKWCQKRPTNERLNSFMTIVSANVDDLSHWFLFMCLGFDWLVWAPPYTKIPFNTYPLVTEILFLYLMIMLQYEFLSKFLLRNVKALRMSSQNQSMTTSWKVMPVRELKLHFSVFPSSTSHFRLEIRWYP